MMFENEVEFLLLGQFVVRDGESQRPFPPLRRKTRALLAYLVAVNAPCTRQTLMDMFCQNANSPSRTLTLLLSRIRKQVDVLNINNHLIQFEPSATQVDYLSFQQVLEGVLAEQPVGGIETAVSRYRGEFLEGLTLPNAPEFEMWLLNQRARARQLWERGLGELVRRYSANGRFQSAIQHAQQLLHSDPLLEEAHAHLIWLYAQTGQREAAMQQYTHCRALLQEELGVEPTDELQKLHADILSGELKRPLHQTQIIIPPTTAAISPDFVGRAMEYGQLQAAWHAVQAGHGITMMVHAPAGGGKTRLVQELIHTLPAAAVYIGSCYESARALPYQPWLTILETHLQRLDDAALRQLPLATQAYMSRLLPEMARRLPETAVPTSIINETDHLFTAVVDFLSQSPASGAVPYLLFLDDLQWADEISLRLLHYVSQRISRFSWLLIGAYRTEEVDDTPALALLIDDLARHDVQQIQLSPLTAVDIEALTVHLWTRLADGYRGHIATMLAQATGGNALFVTAVLQELATSDDVPTELPVPATVQELIQRRLRRLPQGERQPLEALAVLGDGATVAQLQRISARSSEEAAQALEWGGRWGLVTADTASMPISYRFQHDLVREAIYAGLSAVRKQRLHRRTAVWFVRIAQRQAETVQQEKAGQILYHAQRGEAFGLIFRWSPIAAARARQLFAYQRAMHALDAMRVAFEHIQFTPDFDLNAAEPLFFDQLIWWLTHSKSAGKSMGERTAVLRQAEALLERHPSPIRTAQFQFITANIMLTNEEAVLVMLDAHRQFLQLGELSLAAAALAAAAEISITMGQNRDGRRFYEQALDLYQQVGDTAGETSCLTGLAWTAINLGQIQVSLARSQQALAISKSQGDKLGEALALFSATASWTFYYVPEKVRELATKTMQIYEQVGFPQSAARARLYLGSACSMELDWEGALTIFEEVLAQAVVVRDAWIMGWAAQLAGRMYLLIGNLDAAAEKLGMARQLRLDFNETQNQVSDLAWMGRLALFQNDTATALDFTAQAVAALDAFQDDCYVWEQPDVLMCRAEALIAVGRTEEALSIMQRAQTVMHQFAEQIDDPDILAQFMAYPLNARIETAVSAQQLPSLED